MYKIKDYEFKGFKLIAEMHHSNYAVLESEPGFGIKYCPHLDFADEFCILTELDHKQIPKAHDYGKAMMYKDGKDVLMQNFIVLDHMSSIDFLEYFKKILTENFLGSLDYFLKSFISACDPLGYIHSKGYIHTDIKPGHLMLNKESGKVCFIDFELVIKKAGLIKGFSKDYSSPEYEGLLQMLRNPPKGIPEEAIAYNVSLDDRTDIYSFGALIFETLTQKKWSDTKTPPREINNLIPQKLEDIILAMLEKDPANRIATAQELKQRLMEL